MRPTTFDPAKVRLGNQLSTLRRLLPYLWPAGRGDLKLRVLVAVGLLIAAKLANITVPMILREAVDALTPTAGVAAATLVLALPLALLLAYGAARVLAIGFGELRAMLDAQLNDQRSAWEMQPDGSYVQRRPDDEEALGSQETLITRAEARLREATRLRRRKLRGIERRNLRGA